MHISQLPRCPHLQQCCRRGTRCGLHGTKRIGRVNRLLPSLGNGRYRSIMPLWSNDRGLVSTRSRTDTSRVDGSSTGNRSLLTGICVSGPALFHISKVVVSLSFSLSLSSLPILALFIADPKTPIREILPRRTISSLRDLRGIESSYDLTRGSPSPSVGHFGGIAWNRGPHLWSRWPGGWADNESLQAWAWSHGSIRSSAASLKRVITRPNLGL